MIKEKRRGGGERKKKSSGGREATGKVVPEDAAPANEPEDANQSHRTTERATSALEIVYLYVRAGSVPLFSLHPLYNTDTFGSKRFSSKRDMQILKFCFPSKIRFVIILSFPLLLQQSFKIESW